MTSSEPLAGYFETQRPRLRAVAHRILGSTGEAEDAVQEAWLRLARTDPDTVDNLDAWLTTVVGRVCLDVLRRRRSRREDPLDTDVAVPAHGDGADPENAAVLADSLGLAVLTVLNTLGPAERLAFVLHDMFAVPFDEIAGIIGRSPAATRQLASRARRRVRGAEPVDATELAGRRRVVDAFLTAARDGDFTGLMSVLDPQVELRADEVAVGMARSAVEAGHAGAPRFTARTRGAEAVATAFNGSAQGARPALVDGLPGAVWAPGGRIRSVFVFEVSGDRVTGVEVIADQDRIAELAVVIG